MTSLKYKKRKRASGSWKRIADISGDELWTRGHQELRKRWDTLIYRVGASPRIGRLEPFGSSQSKRFFFDEKDVANLISEIQRLFPRSCERKIGEAEKICRGEFDLLGYRDVPYGRKPDWHAEIIHGHRSSAKPWYKIGYLNFAEVGDSKIIWEMNRHQHLVALAIAYRMSGNAGFGHAIFDKWFDWQGANPYPIGINWASSLEVAFRSMSWLWVWQLMSGTSAMPVNFRKDLCQALALNGHHIENYLSTYFSPNTHLIGEAVALFFIGVLCPEISAASAWKDKGWQTICREAQRQVRKDGVYFEQSTYYHAYAVDFFLHARILAARNGIVIPDEFDQNLQRMLNFLCDISQAGITPRLGDDDGGRVFDPHRNCGQHLLDPLATGAILFRRADWKAAARDIREETVWLLGMQGIADFNSLVSSEPVARTVCFPEAGIYVMADGGALRQQLVIDAGPQGEGNSGHGHADALSVHLSIAGHEWLTDPGTFSYLEGKSTREAFRSTAAHNTLQVDSESQAVPNGPFSWTQVPDVYTDIWQAGRTCALFEGHHTGYARLKNPVIHRRSIFYLSGRFWLIRDVAEGLGEHQLDLFWHVAPDVNLRRCSTDLFLLQRNNCSGPALFSTGAPKWTSEIISGQFSSAYGCQESAPVIVFSAKTELPCGLTTLVLPRDGNEDRLGRLVNVSGTRERENLYSCAYHESEKTHQWVFSEQHKHWKLGELASDARLTYCLFNESNRLQRVCIFGGSFVEFQGKSILQSNKLLPFYESENQFAEEKNRF